MEPIEPKSIKEIRKANPTLIPPPPPQGKEPRVATNIILIIILLVLITGGLGLYSKNVGISGVWNKISAAAVSLASVFSHGEKIKVTVSNSVVPNNKPFTISFTHTGKIGEGVYQFSYTCQTGLYFQVEKADSKKESPFCNAPFDLSGIGTSTSLTLIPLLLGTTSAETTLTINYQKAASATSTTEKETAVSGSTDVTVVETLNASNGSTETSATALPDLTVKITAIGIIDKNTKVFTATSALKSTDQIAVRFEIANVGNGTSDDWTFDAELPTTNQYTFHSDKQSFLYPGDRVEFTLGFDNVAKADGNVVTINVDPSGLTQEITKANNIAEITINNVQF